jgi:hypothetical protein
MILIRPEHMKNLALINGEPLINCPEFLWGRGDSLKTTRLYGKISRLFHLFSSSLLSFLRYNDCAPGCPAGGRFFVYGHSKWPNRLIGDQHLPENERYTETNLTDMATVYDKSRKYFEKDDPLRPSGLAGPVNVIAVRNQK